ncbi:MAG: NADH-quinone oxidoreductase subunit NuoF [Oscillospiraceae bacterium]|nr:NADH-quinone oxidoreductase subunit NuoF [Oscillospiraceae bacterium]
MSKVTSQAQLRELREKYAAAMLLRDTPEIPVTSTEKSDGIAKKHVLLCTDTGCEAAEGSKIYDTFISELKANGIEKEVNVIKTGCFGFCKQGTCVKVFPEDVSYVMVTSNDVPEIVSSHLKNDEHVERLLFKDPITNELIHTQHEIPFYKGQVRIALRNCGLIAPTSIDEYIAQDGYEALSRSIFEMEPKEIIDKVKAANLRGRGGGGFPAGDKWESTARAVGEKKYVICNGDEGDPGAFMDRAILYGDPHSVLEAMAICGRAIGADEGVIYTRAEYPKAVKMLNAAIKQAEERGLLGDNILGSDFSFKISVTLGAGAFVCGESTALLNSAQGQRGEPRNKPPRTADKGLWFKPTSLNNVETFACVPPILIKGADWFKSIGTENSPGTKIFALAGKINTVGLIEVPMGITIREIVENIGGGVKDGKKLKAVQTGGPSGGCIAADGIDIEVDFDSLDAIGSMMGSGGMIVLDEDDCMVNVAKFYMDFIVEESCGKCTPCRVGTKRMLEILERITDGHGTEEDLVELENLSEVIQNTSLCGLGQSAPNPVVSTLKYFRDEYIAHVRDKKCPAGACTNMTSFRIIADKCIGCTVCAKVCPVSCISGELKQPHVIDQEKCVKCGACVDKCKFAAIVRE